MVVKERTFTVTEESTKMYLQPYALQTLVPGEPTPEAFYRELKRRRAA